MVVDGGGLAGCGWECNMGQTGRWVQVQVRAPARTQRV